MAYKIRIEAAAEADLQRIYLWISQHASPVVARAYVNRIVGYLSGFDQFPERGSLRNEIRPGLRIIGFRRRVSIAFMVEADEVIVLRILYGGQQLSFDDDL